MKTFKQFVKDKKKLKTKPPKIKNKDNEVDEQDRFNTPHATVDPLGMF